MTLDELNVLVNVSAEEALEKLDELIEKARSLGTLAGEDGLKLGISPESIAPAMEALGAFGETAREQTAAVSEGFLTGAESVAAFLNGLCSLAEKAEKGEEALSGMGDALEGACARDAAETLGDASAEMDRAQKSAGELSASAREMERRWGAITAVKKNIQEFRDLRSEYQRAESGGRDVTSSFDRLKVAAGKLGLQVDGSRESMDRCGKSLDTLEKNVNADAQGMVGALGAMLLQAQQTEAGLNIRAAMGVDVSQPLSAIQAVIAIINALLSLMGQAGIKASGGKRSGGGGRSGGGSSASVSSGNSALEAEYDRIEHMRHMNEISMEQELALVEALRSRFAMNASEAMQWEEKVYDLREELRQRDAESLDELADSVKDALSARYESMRDAELSRLEESREAWESWRDGSVAAIEEQIAALDALADTEDREAKDAEELRKIEKLRREMEYEQDAYNRAKLAQQLDAALAARAERLRKLELQDEKAALEKQIELIESRTEQELALLDEREAAMEAAAEERLKDAAVEAEAQKLLLTKSQDELLALLSQYAPEYDALGKTLGEKLLNGFEEKVGGIADWFRSFGEQLGEAQAQIARTVGAQTPTDFGAAGNVSISQQNTFVTPVETPSETARRIRQANEELAGELMRSV